MATFLLFCVAVPALASDAMADPLFEAAFQHTLANEGTALTNDPRDRGGLTAYGITQRSYTAYLKRPATLQDMADITVERARSFYYIMFWQPLRERLPDAPEPTVLALFDIAVNTGAATAVALAQTALGGGLSVDGKLGPLTAAAITQAAPHAFLQAFIAQVVARYTRVVVADPTQVAFLTGWVSRALRLWDLLPVVTAPGTAVA